LPSSGSQIESEKSKNWLKAPEPGDLPGKFKKRRKKRTDEDRKKQKKDWEKNRTHNFREEWKLQYSWVDVRTRADGVQEMCCTVCVQYPDLADR
jgi:hypothetical protein